MDSQESNYLKFRGRCKEMSEALAASDPSLKAVWGYYHDAIWGSQEHWWCQDHEGNIVDPTKLQFTDQNGEYEIWDGTITCANCKKIIHRSHMVTYGRYAFCSGSCVYDYVM